MNLLHWVVQQIEEDRPELLRVVENYQLGPPQTATQKAEHFQYLKEASQYSLVTIREDIKAMKTKIESVSQQLEKTDSHFQQKMKMFLSEALDSAKDLEEDVVEIDQLEKSLAEFFCEDDGFKLEECIKIFYAFFEKLKKAIQV